MHCRRGTLHLHELHVLHMPRGTIHAFPRPAQNTRSNETSRISYLYAWLLLPGLAAMPCIIRSTSALRTAHYVPFSRGALVQAAPEYRGFTLKAQLCWLCSWAAQGDSEAADCVGERAHAQPPAGGKVQAGQGEHDTELAEPTHKWQAAQPGANV